jgi:hypothetical protein
MSRTLRAREESRGAQIMIRAQSCGDPSLLSVARDDGERAFALSLNRKAKPFCDLMRALSLGRT